MGKTLGIIILTMVRWSWAFCYGMKRSSNIFANSPSKQQGGRHIIVIRAMGSVDRVITLRGGGGCFSFGGTVQYIEESNIYLCFVVCRLKRGLVT